jgi:hypothetical protein
MVFSNIISSLKNVAIFNLITFVQYLGRKFSKRQKIDFYDFPEYLALWARYSGMFRRNRDGEKPCPPDPDRSDSSDFIT